MKLAYVSYENIYPRYHFANTLKLAEYIDVHVFCGKLFFNENPNGFINNNHKIDVLKKIALKGRLEYWINLILFNIRVTIKLKKMKPDIMLIKNNRLAWIFPLFIRKKRLIALVPVAGVARDKKKLAKSKRRVINSLKGYKFYFAYSDYLAAYYKLKLGTYSIVKFGVMPPSFNMKVFKEISLLYIGAISNRDIHKTIYGLKLFKDKYTNIKIKYSIIGEGSYEYVDKLNNAIANCGLSNSVTYHGYLPDNQITKFFDNCNVGVSYVPKTFGYNNNPVTKTYEYLLSGMAVIATNTEGNKEVITEKNGILIHNSPESFSKGLEKIYNKLYQYDSQIIRDSIREWDVRYSVPNILWPAINEIISKSNVKECQ